MFDMVHSLAALPPKPLHPRGVTPGCKRLLRRAGLLVFALLLLSPYSAQAALKAKGSAASIEEATNPKPDGTDILLPMPCNSVMAFKAVGTQADGFLWDVQTMFGCDDCGRTGNDYYERRYSTAVSGPFSAADVPEGWRGKLESSKGGEYYYYFIGKYEVTNFQWRAVMEGWCPSESSPLSTGDSRPKADISWYDAQAFSQKYTEWLLKNAPDSLPRYAGDGKNVGYLRLPTEAEWEYAARGGQKAARADLRETDFFSRPEGSPYSDYAVYRSESRIEEQAQPVGSRKPNPLGLYDTAGNVAEMVQDAFHFSLGGRLHGSAGGFIRKGGGYLSGQGEIMPGRREEVAFFQAQGPTRNKDMGLRLVLSGINTPAGNRPAILAEEWRKAGEGEALLLDQGKNPLEELDRLAAKTTSPTEKENLQRLRAVLKDNNIALERRNEAAADGLIRSSLFMMETIRNYAVRHKSLINFMADAKRERDTAKNMNAAAKAAVEQTIAGFEASRQNMRRSMDAAVAFYRSKVEESLQYPEKMFSTRLQRLQGEFTGEDLFAQNMRKTHGVYTKHVDTLRRGKHAQLSRDAILKDILPENIQEGLGLK